MVFASPADKGIYTHIVCPVSFYYYLTHANEMVQYSVNFG